MMSNNTNTTGIVTSDIAVILTVLSKSVCVLILFLGIIGNSLVLIVFGSRWSRLKACEIFMINLAVADLIGTLVTPTIQLFEIEGGDFTPIGDVGCKLIHFSIITSVTVSSLTLVGITFDRFVIVRWPMRQRVSFKTLRYVMLLTWILGCGPGILYLVGKRVRLYRENEVLVCRMFVDEDEKRVHTVITFSVQVIIPLLLMILLYSLITYELWKSTKTRQFAMREREMRLRYKRNKKAIKLLVALVIMFFVCIAPVNTFYLLYTFKAFDPVSLGYEMLILLFTIMQMLQMMNSCINPLIYSKLHTSFRRTTLKIFCSCCFEKVRNYQWEDFGETVKFAMTSSLHYAKRLSKGNLPLIRPIPNFANRSRVYRNGQSIYQRDNRYKFSRKGLISKRVRIAVDENGGITSFPLERKNSLSQTPFFSLTRSHAYRKTLKAPPSPIRDCIKLSEVNRTHLNDTAFVSSSIFPKHRVKFDTQPLLDTP